MKGEHMMQALRGLAVVYGLAEPRPGSLAIRRTLNAAEDLAPWYPPTPPPRVFDDTVVDTLAPLLQLELHHNEYAIPEPPRRTWAQAEVLASWRRRMDAWLDSEWLAWREVLHTYPMPGERT
jgi:hypothetical protein